MWLSSWEAQSLKLFINHHYLQHLFPHSFLWSVCRFNPLPLSRDGCFLLTACFIKYQRKAAVISGDSYSMHLFCVYCNKSLGTSTRLWEQNLWRVNTQSNESALDLLQAGVRGQRSKVWKLEPTRWRAPPPLLTAQRCRGWEWLTGGSQPPHLVPLCNTDKTEDPDPGHHNIVCLRKTKGRCMICSWSSQFIFIPSYRFITI